MSEDTPRIPESLDAVVVGAGFAGLYMLHKLRELGLEARICERGSGVGGTWYWNRYPGARCDVNSMEYSYEFDEALQQEWEWTERYATQPEILRYANHVADRFDLRGDIVFDTTVESARWSDDGQRWHVRTSAGETSARFLIMATGCLSSTNVPDFPGLETYRGDWYHTGDWPHEPVDFTGKRVAVIGTGSSAIQSIPIIAEQAAHLHVFQRTPNYSVPAHNEPLAPEDQAAIKARYPKLRAENRRMAACFGSELPPAREVAMDDSADERRAIFEERWRMGGLPFIGGYADVLIDPASNEAAAGFVREKIHEIVDDPQTADLLSPDQKIGCKRMCVDTGYYATFNRDNVTLVDISGRAIDAITETGLRVGDETFDFDAIVFATGFDAMTGSLLKIDVVGRDGLSLREKWEAGPRTYLGLEIAGFPNMFTISGPGSPSVLTNMLVSIQQHVEFIADALAWMDEHGKQVIEAEPAAEDEWVDVVNAVADVTLFPTCNSWYLGANVPGKPRVFMPFIGFPPYAAKCEEVAAKGYEGFRFA